MVSGAAVSTVKLRDAGVGSTLPAGSVARTSKVWAPSASVAVVSGVEQEPHAPPSTRHSKLEPAWSDENAKVGVVSLVGPEGPLSIVGLRRGRVDRERRATPGRVDVPGRVGRAHLEGVRAVGQRRGGLQATSTSPMRRRRRGTRSSSPPGLAENANVGVASFVGPDGPLSIVVSGAAVSTVKLRDAGVASTLPAVSVARTSNVCAPSASDAVVCGELQEAHAPASTRHSNVEPAWLDENANVGVASFVGPDGPLSIVVCGAAVSTVKLRDAGVASTLPAGSVARTSKVWAPSAERRGGVGVELQEAQAPPSTRHSNVEPAWSARTRTSASRRSSGPRGRCRSSSAARPCRP